MQQHSTLAYTLGLGIAGALIGVEAYMLMSPRGQNNMQRSLKKAVDELSDIVEDIGDGMRSMK